MRKLITIILFNAMGFTGYAQATDGSITGNDFTAVKFLGWNTTSGLLQFRTNNITRMTMQSGTAGGFTDGRMAMSNNVPTGFLPQARLHLFQYSLTGAFNADMFRTDGINTADNNWRMFTGPTQAAATEKFRLFIPASTNDAVLRVTQNGSLFGQTASTMRTRINGTLNYAVNGFNTARNGYMLLGQDGVSGGQQLYGPNFGAYSLFHLNGAGTFVQAEGYRPWMQTGVTYTSNNDLSYIGHRQVGAGTDLTETVIGWGDNPASPFGPDVVSFRFTTLNGTGTGNLADLDGSDLDGREVIRVMGTGNVGIGPRFNEMFLPQSTLHQHQENAASSWFQISNQLMSAGGTAPYNGPNTVAPTDGLRLGILGNTNGLQNGIGMLYQQENNHLLFSTNANTTTASPGATQERIRLTSAGTPTVRFTIPFYGTYNPAGVGANITRASISYDPANPINRPTSLLHLGYNAQYVFTTYDGWRPWMDIGTYTASPSDNMYVGLKREGVDHFDAIINWGRNQDSLSQPVPEHLRFIFTSNTTPPVTNAAQTLNGLETGRFYAGKDTLGTYGRFGVGDFTAAGVNQEPTHKLDVVGNGRFRFLPDNIYEADASVTKTVMVDNDGVLRWTQNPPSGGGIGSYCTAAPNPLTGNYNIPLNNFNVYHSGQGLPNTNSVGIGYNCGAVLPGKHATYLSAADFAFTDMPAAVYSTTDSVGSDQSAGAVFLNRHINIPATARTISYGSSSRSRAYNTKTNIGVHGLANTTMAFDPNTGCYGGYFEAAGGNSNVGVYTRVGSTGGATSSATGGVFNTAANNIISASGVNAVVVGNSNNVNYGVQANVFGSTNTNYGVRGDASGGTTNYSIYGGALPATGNYAGYFNGNLGGVGIYSYTSDANLKQNIQPLENASALLSQLQPKTYEYKTAAYPQMHFSTVPQMGVIAQDVQNVLPNLVQQNIFPAQYDSLGNQINAAVQYLGVDYISFIPLLIAGHNELSEKLDEKDSIIQSLNDRLTQIEACLNTLNLCNKSNAPADENDRAANTISVTLADGESIVLDQNVPNPFAEQTWITYELPQSVVKAQMLFYNAEGKLINSVDLNQRGKGQLNVFASDLSNGVYTYTLVADGKIVATKRMVKN